jgi:hypothetical protein
MDGWVGWGVTWYERSHCNLEGLSTLMTCRCAHTENTCDRHACDASMPEAFYQDLRMDGWMDGWMADPQVRSQVTCDQPCELCMLSCVCWV